MSERRSLKRRHLIYYLRVFNRQSGDLLGHVVDITPEGLMIVGEESLPLNKTFSISMKLPTELAGVEELNFEGETRWSRKDVNPEFYATGLHMTGLAEEHIELIRTLVNEFGFED